MSSEKIVSPHDIESLCQKWHLQNAVIVFTNGIFDLLHPGHVQYLTEARKLGTHLVVGLNTDASTKRIKGEQRPLVTLDERLEVLAALSVVNAVTWFDEDIPAEIIRSVRPDVLVKGGDWKPEEIVGKDFVESYGGKVLSIPYVSGYSTTHIVEKILRSGL
jgi:rfaE bifunctional protein nucleotidyltransferase chain/domain